MIYVTVKQERKPKQITWEDVIFDKLSPNQLTCGYDSNSTGTITRQFDVVPANILNKVNIPSMISAFQRFNIQHKKLAEKNRESLYRTFYIPKRSGGLRRIDAPNADLKDALTQLAHILTNKCGVLYHTAAFAYIPGRCVQDVAKKHVAAKSKWYLKTDLSGFFPSTTIEFTMKMLSMVFPLSEVIKDPVGKEELQKALSLGFLNGALPQGSPLSPMLTNVIFLPIDYTLANAFSKRKLVYTRYADDTHISAEERFPYGEIIAFMKKTFKDFGAPYEIKSEKTHFGSYKGQNWMLGMMLNKDFDITVGYRTKKHFKSAMCSFILDIKNGHNWDIEDVQRLYGLLNWYSQVEPQYFAYVVKKINQKWNVNIVNMMKLYMSGKTFYL